MEKTVSNAVGPTDLIDTNELLNPQLEDEFLEMCIFNSSVKVMPDYVAAVD